STLGIAPEATVVGIAGALVWSRRRQYCYGLELVEAARHWTRPDAIALIIGDGSGMAELKRRAETLPPGRVVFTGRLPQSQLPAYYAAMDLASLPQSLDPVGLFRYTTKVSEYLAARLPIVIGPIPLAYDLDTGWIWRVPGGHPWQTSYHRALAQLIDQLTPEAVEAKAAGTVAAGAHFEKTAQVHRVTGFLQELLSGFRTGRRADRNGAEI
ncbi:MAG: glycosyltransferase, partial [Gemmataceae bacterium]